VPFPVPTPAPDASSPTGLLSADVMVDKYLKLRDKVAEIKDRHKKELEPFAKVMEALENMLLDTLNKAGVESMRAPTGTFFKVKHTSCKVNEWSKTLEFIKEHEFWELLEARVSKTAAQEILKSTDKPIPGVVFSTYAEVNVRRPTAKD
jgi:hypothetical protein